MTMDSDPDLPPLRERERGVSNKWLMEDAIKKQGFFIIGFKVLNPQSKSDD